MSRGKVVRVSEEAMDTARQLLSTLPVVRYGPGETSVMSDRQLADTGIGWMIGRLQGDVFTKQEVDQTVMRTLCQVLGETLGVHVNASCADGKLIWTWTAPDGDRHEVTANLEGN